MKFNQLERAVVITCAAVFLLATADGMGMTWVCPASGPGSCSDVTATDEQPVSAVTAIGVSRWRSGDSAGLLGLCPWDERASVERLAGLTVSGPIGPPAQQGIPCPVEAGRPPQKEAR
jgi:hypothetical protein